MREADEKRRVGARAAEPDDGGDGLGDLAESAGNIRRDALGSANALAMVVVAGDLVDEGPAGHTSQEEFDRLRVPAAKKKGRGKEEEPQREERVTAYVSRVELEAMEEEALSEHRTLSSWARMVLNKAVGR